MLPSLGSPAAESACRQGTALDHQARSPAQARAADRRPHVHAHDLAGCAASRSERQTQRPRAAMDGSGERRRGPGHRAQCVARCRHLRTGGAHRVGSRNVQAETPRAVASLIPQARAPAPVVTRLHGRAAAAILAWVVASTALGAAPLLRMDSRAAPPESERARIHAPAAQWQRRHEGFCLRAAVRR